MPCPRTGHGTTQLPISLLRIPNIFQLYFSEVWSGSCEYYIHFRCFWPLLVKRWRGARKMSDTADFSDNFTIDWHDVRNYEYLRCLSREAFAWEWLRRNRAYQRTWLSHCSRKTSATSLLSPSSFGLVSFVDPSTPANIARPVWRADVDNSVLIAEVMDADAPPLEGLDLLAVASLVTLEVDANEDQHLLLSDGKASVRVDIVRGTLLGGRALLSYQLWGGQRLQTPVLSLRRLITLLVTGRFALSLFPPERLASRWILELQVSDALAAGASHREIANLLFGSIIADRNWRDDGGSVRSRVRRAVNTAKRRTSTLAHLDFLARG